MAIAINRKAARCSYSGVADPRTSFHLLMLRGGEYRARCNMHLRADIIHMDPADTVPPDKRCKKCAASRPWPEYRLGDRAPKWGKPNGNP